MRQAGQVAREGKETNAFLMSKTVRILGSGRERGRN
jgi:hypothetical protein